MEKTVFQPDDIQYVRDLGLVNQKEMTIANPIYQEMILGSFDFHHNQETITVWGL